MKTLKDEEKSLLLDKGVLSHYSDHVKANKRSLLSKYLGIFTIRAENMADITCIIMDNLLGKDIMSIERIYDLKGSTKGRREQPGPPLKVLKDLNFIENGESLRLALE